MPKTKNERYLKFLNRQIIEPIEHAQFKELLIQVKHKHLKEARAICIILWTTAARPNEVVRLTRDNINKRDASIWIDLPGSKGSSERTIELPAKNEFVKELWAYVALKFEGLLIFPHFLTHSHRKEIQKTRKLGGEKKVYFGVDGRGYTRHCSTLSYFFNRWFGFPPYVFRHNRMTIAAEKLNLSQLKLLKGAKRESSVWPYVGLTKKEAQKIGRELVK